MYLFLPPYLYPFGGALYRVVLRANGDASTTYQALYILKSAWAQLRRLRTTHHYRSHRI